MAKIMTSLSLTIPEMTNLGDAMNHLSNNSASTAAQLVDFTLRAGQAGKSAGALLSKLLQYWFKQ